MDERWLPVAGYAGLYEVSDRGRVRSLDRVVLKSNGKAQRCKGTVLRVRRVGKNYRGVGLHRDGQQVTRTVHSLVLEAFVGPRPTGHQSRHIDGNPAHNELTNLVYGTPKENAADKALHGTNRTRLVVATHCQRNHEFTAENTEFGSDGARRCKTCRRDRDRVAKRARRAASREARHAA